MEAANDSSEFAANKAKLKALNKMIHQVEYELQGLYFKLDEKVKEKEELLRKRQQTSEKLKVSESKEPEAPANNQYIITNLNPLTPKKSVIEYFSQFGEVADLEMVFIGVKSKGTANITYKGKCLIDRDSLLNFDHLIDGSVLSITDGSPKPKTGAVPKKNDKFDEYTRSIHVSGYISDIEKSDLLSYFSQFGTIVKYSDYYGNKSRFKYVFIKFSSPDMAEKVVAVRDHVVKGIEITVKKAKDL